ncbi:MAG: ribose-5-phosphate isomerase RpiA [Rhizobiales bacterium]|nr:ribose-5-phosphate isomerase RpiA [Hyphomicrobiales bacterium]
MREKAPGDEAGRAAAARMALGEVRAGMKLGLGSGRTAEQFVRFLGEKVKAGLDVAGVPTSERTAALAAEVGVPLTDLDAMPHLDLTVDGADEVGPGFRLVKGGGGALLREKIVAAASDRMLVVVDETKVVATLGAFPLPIEVVPFGLGATRAAIVRSAAGLGLNGDLKLRKSGEAAYLTDGGHFILDASFGRIPDPDALARALDAIPGVVEHGLFIGLAKSVIVGRGGTADWLAP